MKTIDQVAEELYKEKGKKQWITSLPRIIQFAYRGCEVLNQAGDNLSISSSSGGSNRLCYSCKITDRVAPEMHVYCNQLDDNSAAISMVIIR